ncbi:MAG: hypothetical protein AUH86_25520 [Acidobacteria bacterium 13_1_40CM_4_58_4]|nr:MAG: hypothetical protein AUH86_25520 [Acidobacteria bacterium 13_1_40CM_4_58_4]
MVSLAIWSATPVFGLQLVTTGTFTTAGTLKAAYTWTVTNRNDSGPGSLRAAIANAGSGDTINFALTYDPSGAGNTIKLSSGPLTINKSLTISGPGWLAISGENSDVVFVVNGVANATISGVTIEYGNNFLGNCILNTATLTLTNSSVVSCGKGVNPDGSTYSSPKGQWGGGVFNMGTLKLINTQVYDNHVGCDCSTYVGSGGGIFNYFGTVTLTNSDVSWNDTHGNANPGPSVGGGGGGIFNYGGTVTLANSTARGNTSSFGGVIFNYFGTLSAANSTISDNIGWGSGGGILNVAAPNTTVVNATVTLTSSTLSGNVAYGSDFVSYNALPIPGSGSVSGGGGGGGCDPSNCIPFQSSKSQIFAIMGGGGIYNSQGTMTLTNATISGNSASSVSSQFAGGGGILNDEGTASLTNTTLFGNSAPPPGISSSAYSGGGGINTIAGTLIIKNSILANNLQGKNCGKYLGGGSSWGYTLSDDASCAAVLTMLGDRNSTAAGLDSGLKNNGGPVQTIALLATSPAVNAIPLIYCTDVNGNPVTTDERGVSRPQGSACDIGAFEYVAPRVTTGITVPVGVVR